MTDHVERGAAQSGGQVCPRQVARKPKVSWRGERGEGGGRREREREHYAASSQFLAGACMHIHRPVAHPRRACAQS